MENQTMTTLNDNKLQQLLDKQAITEVLHQYCRGADRCDEELMMSCYHPDATDQHNFFSGNGQEFCKHAISTLRRLRSSNHRVSNILIELNGDRAFAESYVHIVHRPVIDGKAIELHHYGRYLDVLERRNDEWKILHRHYVQDSNSIVQQVEIPVEENALSVFSKRYPDDLVYQKFNVVNSKTKDICLDID
jgi:ketosteroid isomerase-like protein